MPEIQPDLSDRSRCISVHWSLPVQCVLPCTHVENWHEAWHPGTGNRIRYRRTMGVFRTEDLHDGGWHDLEIPPPGEVCGEPHSDKPGVFCQVSRQHNEISWTHRALFEGCTYTWNSIRREPTPEQVAQDLARVREMAAGQATELVLLRQVVTNVRYLHRVHRCDGQPEDCPCADDRAEAGGDVCAHCTQAWPCTTAAYVQAANGGMA